MILKKFMTAATAVAILAGGGLPLGAQQTKSEPGSGKDGARAPAPLFRDLRPLPQSSEPLQVETTLAAAQRQRGELQLKLNNALRQLALEQAARRKAEKARQALDLAHQNAIKQNQTLKQTLERQTAALYAREQAQYAAEIAARHQEKLRRDLEQKLADLQGARAITREATKPAAGSGLRPAVLAPAIARSRTHGSTQTVVAQARRHALAEARRRAKAARLRQRADGTPSASQAGNTASPPAQ